MLKIDISKPVRFVKPKHGEKNLVFRITDFGKKTKRCIVKPVNLKDWEEGTEPEMLVSIHDLVNV